MPVIDDAPPAVSAEARRLVDDLYKARWGYQEGNEIEAALLAYIARLEAWVAEAEVPRGLYLALADAAPGIWTGGHRCDGAIRVGLPGERASIGQDIPAADARAAVEAVNFVRRLDAAQRGSPSEPAQPPRPAHRHDRDHP